MILVAVLLVALLLALRVWGVPMFGDVLQAPYALWSVRLTDLLLVLALVQLADSLLRRLYWERYLRRKRGHVAPALMRDLVTMLLFAVAISLWLYLELGVAASGLIAASGATAVVVGFALQNMILDWFSGLSVNFDRSFVIGDWLTVHSEEFIEPVYGKIEGMTWRTTVMRLEDDTCVMVPNRLMTSNPVTNHSRPPGPKRLSAEITLDMSLPTDRALRLLQGVAHKTVRGGGLSAFPPPKVLISRLVDDAATYEVQFYADPDKMTPKEARSLMIRRLQDAVRGYGLPISAQLVELKQPAEQEPSVNEAAVVRAALERVPLFARVLSAEQLDELAGYCFPVAFDAGTDVIRQGDEGSSMFVILEGAARVTIASPAAAREVAVLSDGDVFGEMSLMTGAPRSATVSALSDLRALEITKAPVEALLAQSPELLEDFGRVLHEREERLREFTSKDASQVMPVRDLLTIMRSFFARALQ